MSLGDLIEEASEIATLILLIPVGIVIVIMLIGGLLFQDFPTLYFFGLGVELWAQALVPNILLIGLLAIYLSLD